MKTVTQPLSNWVFHYTSRNGGLWSRCGRCEVETAGVAALRRGFQPIENTELGRNMPFMEDTGRVAWKAAK